MALLSSDQQNTQTLQKWRRKKQKFSSTLLLPAVRFCYIYNLRHTVELEVSFCFLGRHFTADKRGFRLISWLSYMYAESYMILGIRWIIVSRTFHFSFTWSYHSILVEQPNTIPFIQTALLTITWCVCHFIYCCDLGVNQHQCSDWLLPSWS